MAILEKELSPDRIYSSIDYGFTRDLEAERARQEFARQLHRQLSPMRDAINSPLGLRVPIQRIDRSGYIPDKPSIDMLTAIAAPELVEGDSRQALAVEVEDLLGYTPLRQDAKAPSRLQRLLAELEIEAFDPGKVREYKQKMCTHFQAVEDAKAHPEWGSMIQLGWRETPLKGYSKPVPEHVLRKAVQIKQAAPDAVFTVDELIRERRTLDPFLVVQLGEDKAYIEVWDEPEFEKSL